MSKTTAGRNGRGIRPRVGLAVVACLLAVKSGSGGSEDEVGRADPWPVGAMMAVEVDSGRASFEVPTPEPNSQVLLIVSPMSRSADSYPIRVEVKPSRAAGRSSELERWEPPGRILALPEARPLPPPTVGMPPTERVFSILAREGDPASASNYERVRGRLRAVGSWVQVYVDERDLGRVGPETLRDLVGTFDEHVLPTAARLFGTARDVDGDGRFTVLLTGKLAALAGGEGVLDGFVRGADFDPSLPEPFGNRADLMYLSANLGSGPYLRTILAHEYTHAVTFCRKVADRPGGFAGNRDEEGWLDEGLAHLTEDLHGFSRENLDYRVRAFLSAPERYQLVVKDYYEADLFRSHGNRGSTYLFLHWCAERFGPGLLPALIRSPLRGIQNLERTTGASFEDLYRGWSAALFLDLLTSTSEATTTRAARWSPAGPRTTFVRPGGRAETWEAPGTASRYLVIGASSTGAARIEVSAPSEADLQVTAIRLPDDLSRLELGARPSSRSEEAPSFQFRVQPREGAPVRLESLCWGPLKPPLDPRRRRRSVGLLTGADLKAALGGRELLNAGDRVESIPIAWPDPRIGGDRLLLRLVGKDGRGRRVVGWTEVDRSSPVDFPPEALTTRARLGGEGVTAGSD